MIERTVLLVEDDAATRERLASIVGGHPQLQLLAAVGCCAEARQWLEADVHLDVLLSDLGLPDGSGIDLIRQAHARAQAPEIMVITVFGDEQHVVSAIEAGATGYLLKDGDPTYIGEAILQLLAGGSPISSRIARYLKQRFQPRDNTAPAEQQAEYNLTPREREVLALVAKGFTYTEIAGMLGMSFHVRLQTNGTDLTSD